MIHLNVLLAAAVYTVAYFYFKFLLIPFYEQNFPHD